MASNFAWGIDVGNRALKAVKLVREGDQLRVDDFEVIEHETVLSNAGDNKETLVGNALASFVQRHPFRGGQVAIGVSGQSSFARFIKLPPVEEKKIPEIVKFEAIQQIPFPLDDVEWSYQLFQSAESPDVEVGIFAMRKELVNAQLKYYTDFDLNVQVVQMNPLAVYNGLQHDGRFDDGTTMVIDIGAENTDLIIADNETIWMRSIPIGGNSFTETLVKAFKLPFNKAEDLKRNSATSKYARQIFQAMRPVFADLVAEIQRSVGFYASVHRDSRIKKILAIGGAFKLPGLQKYLQQNLQLDVERLDNIAAAPSSESKLAPTFNENILSIVSAYGLAIQAMGDGKITSNLLPAKIRREKLWRAKTPLFGAAAALFVLGVGIPAASWWIQNASLNNASAIETQGKIKTVVDRATQLDGQWQTIESSGAADRQKIKNVKDLQSYRTLWPKLLIDVHGALPQAKPDVQRQQPELVSEDPQAIKKIPRGQRKQVLIDSMTSVYYPDASLPLGAPDLRQFVGQTPQAVAPIGMPPQMGGGEGMGEGEAYGGGGVPPQMQMQAQQPAQASAGGAAGAQRGFLVVMHTITPNTDGPELVKKEFLSQLATIQRDAKHPDREYAILKPVVVSAVHIKEDETRKQKIRGDYQAAVNAANQALQLQGMPAMGGGYGGGETDQPAFGGRPMPMPGGAAGAMGPGGVVNQDDPIIFADRATGEDVRDDWEVTVAFFVQLDPPPVTPAAPGGATASAAGNGQ
jgi:type IV pilus assembly protein PilM